jgi:MerR family transcriptional regulator, thiopeptide resistance regulator
MIMAKRAVFAPVSEEKQKDYERSARLQYGPETVNESIKRWNNYTEAQRAAIGEEGNQVYSDLVDAIEAGLAPENAEVQAILQRWENHLRYFYEPTLEVLRGLGETYNTHPEFIANFQKLHVKLPEFLQQSIMEYVDVQETAEIVRLLAMDEGE